MSGRCHGVTLSSPIQRFRPRARRPARMPVRRAVGRRPAGEPGSRAPLGERLLPRFDRAHHRVDLAAARRDPAGPTPRASNTRSARAHLAYGRMLETPELDTGSPVGTQGAPLENRWLLDPSFGLSDPPTGVVERASEARPDHGVASFRESAAPFTLSSRAAAQDRGVRGPGSPTRACNRIIMIRTATTRRSSCRTRLHAGNRPPTGAIGGHHPMDDGRFNAEPLDAGLRAGAACRPLGWTPWVGPPHVALALLPYRDGSQKCDRRGGASRFANLKVAGIAPSRRYRPSSTVQSSWIACAGRPGLATAREAERLTVAAAGYAGGWHELPRVMTRHPGAVFPSVGNATSRSARAGRPRRPRTARVPSRLSRPLALESRRGRSRGEMPAPVRPRIGR
jgi:hypothetical protein